MRVGTGQIIARGLTGRCPNRGGRTLFRGITGMADNCRVCGLTFEREEGFFLGAMVINYTLTAVLVLTPVLVAAYLQAIGVVPAVLAAVAGSVILPVLLYRPSKSLWLMTYYAFLPRDLPANQS